MSRLNKRISDRRTGNPARQAEKAQRAEALKAKEPDDSAKAEGSAK